MLVESLIIMLVIHKGHYQVVCLVLVPVVVNNGFNSQGFAKWWYCCFIVGYCVQQLSMHVIVYHIKPCICFSLCYCTFLRSIELN